MITQIRADDESRANAYAQNGRQGTFQPLHAGAGWISKRGPGRRAMISVLKEAIARRSRAQRAALFRQLFPDCETARVLDLGGGSGRHFATCYPQIRNVTVADFNPSALARAAERYGFRTQLIGDAGPLPFEDQAFDIIFCSSVIEHVTGPKGQAVARFKCDGPAFRRDAARHQRRFADEVRRIGARYFVQTPHRYFPVEVHSWIPLLGFLQTHLQWRVIQVFNRFWPRRNESPDWALLSLADMRALFPEAAIHRERAFGFTKSLIAVGGRPC
jgi:SAM-dependent methyltransferase